MNKLDQQFHPPLQLSCWYSDFFCSLFSLSTLIFFVCKANNSFCLYVNDQGPNNFMIKNRYLLPHYEFPDRLRRAKGFTQMELTSAYHKMRIKEANKWKTVFRTRYGYFEHQVMFFGVFNTLVALEIHLQDLSQKTRDFSSSS